ncbi:S8 family serine peptidase [Fibrivirga algicola]|uniref:S8 family serine peptidase n=1 Tax=Fibrivirga algicola TaxID=2950420 RepID=A0ABX0QJA5_9BACT|nr:S8 family serine peptidase [Fibrivirga algicola]ARK11629.1 peptidase S8 [Fibrella sp. ES10-3-2-2]NID12500.1 S8 family serine peptidase [Fibrivirga algicola]
MKNTSITGPLALALMTSLSLPFCGQAQSLNPSTRFNQWSYKDPATDSIPGISLDKAYQLLKGRKSVPVTVGVVDSGIDLVHEDLRDVIWKNPKETPGNNADDDKNGYVDDVNGWNFMGAKDGTTYEADLDEVGQITTDWKAKFDKADPARLSAKEKKQYDIYQKAKAQSLKPNVRSASLRALVRDSASYVRGIDAMAAALAGKPFVAESVAAAQVGTDTAAIGAKYLIGEIFDPRAGSFNFLTSRVKDLYAQLKELVIADVGTGEPPVNARKAVGDDPNNPNERYYGSPKLIIGSSEELAMHGTHVAGIIGAKRNNGVGVDGVADNVRLMMVGVVPSGGDERDKDVANGIRYAVDNGAKVINMSFGKRFSPYKDAVDEAIRYAESKDVLLVHAAGNNGENVDSLPTYPRPEYEDGSIAKNYITVGNSTIRLGSTLPASSSNYGTRVDLFAPGTDIDATTPHNTYQKLTGTSMAAPCVAGVAALLRSYFPNLTAVQVKDILLKSAYKPDVMVRLPGRAGGSLVPFSSLSKSGGIVNAYEAVKLAMTVK